MEIDTDGAVRETCASGDFRAGHAFHEPQDERFTVSVGKRANGLEDGKSFRVVRGARNLRRVPPNFRTAKLLCESNCRLMVTIVIVSSVTSDSRKPARKSRGVPQGAKPRESLEENVVNKVLGGGKRHTREEDTVDHASIAIIQEAEGGAVATLGGADQCVIGFAGAWRRIHDHQTQAGGVEFEECSHDGSIGQGIVSPSRRK